MYSGVTSAHSDMELFQSQICLVSSFQAVMGMFRFMVHVMSGVYIHTLWRQGSMLYICVTIIETI